MDLGGPHVGGPHVRRDIKLSEIHKKSITKIKKRMYQHSVTAESVRLGILLAVVGGFLDAYTYIGHGGVFANAQTGNIVLLAINATNGNYTQAFYSFLPIVAFILGVLVSEAIKSKLLSNSIDNWQIVVIGIEIIVLSLIGFMPKGASNILITVTISFVSSVQITSFKKLVDSPYSTTMCTGNLRTASEAAYRAYVVKDKKESKKAIRYFIIILFFVLGAIIGGIFTISMGNKSIWITVVILIIALLQFKIDEHIFNGINPKFSK